MTENSKTTDSIEANETVEPFVRIEPVSSTNLVNMRAQKNQANRASFSLHPPRSSPTFDEHTRLFLNRSSSRKKRLVGKNGSLKVLARNVPGKTKLYFADLFTTVIDLHWPWVILIFCGSYVLSWLLFALLWWLIIAIRGPSVCVTEVYDWSSAFLFSIETEQTIGYGSRAITTKCPEAAIVLQIQSLIGLILDAFLLGLTFAKLSQPRERMKTVMFSENAVIAPRDGKLCLMFRVGDIRKSQIVDASIRMQLFRKWTTSEGKEIPFYQEDLRVCYDWQNPANDFRNELFLLLPMVIIHVIDEKSPFFEITPDQLKESDYEIVVVLDGIVEHTGMNTQPKTSYTSDEILWGYDFLNVIGQDFIENGKYFVDFSKFNEIRNVEMQLCSPKEFYEMQH